MRCSALTTTGGRGVSFIAAAVVVSSLSVSLVHGWSSLPANVRTQYTRPTDLFLSSETADASSSTETADDNGAALAATTEEVSKMRLSEIKSELKDRNVDFSDCFDKESMVSKLADARLHNIDNSADETEATEPETVTTTTVSGDFDRDAALEELKGMRVRELREELGRRRISRAGLFEKEDLVNALLEARTVASVFSATGLLTPGEVSDLSEDDVRQEIDHAGSLLLLDVYATWCGPCQMIAPFLKEIAAEQGDQLRVIKMDSDKHPKLSSELKVSGLPTLVLFKGGTEVDRIEGAPTKEQLAGWIEARR